MGLVYQSGRETNAGLFHRAERGLQRIGPEPNAGFPEWPVDLDTSLEPGRLHQVERRDLVRLRLFAAISIDINLRL